MTTAHADGWSTGRDRVVPARSRLLRRAFRRSRSLLIITAAATALASATVAVCWHLFPFPTGKLDRFPASPMVTDRSGTVLLRIVGDDDQWRLPVPLARMSPWLVEATIAVEDERFRRHPGVDPLAVARAAGQNIAAGGRVSGASTLTMQICRMMDDRPRTWKSKLIESFRALQLDHQWSKDQIIQTYLNIAPYGRNLRGVEAASLAYFGKHASSLSLGEAALLVGLPQSPQRYRPDRNPALAMARRRTVLRRMVEQGVIDHAQAAEAAREPVRGGRLPAVVSELAYHAAFFALQRRPAGGCTTIDMGIQGSIHDLVHRHAGSLPPGTDVAVVVIDIQTGDLLAMVGSADAAKPGNGQVNGAMARRSPGSALKPFVYAAAMEAGRLDIRSVVYDVPIERSGWAPQNFDRTFSGPVRVREALARSLNVPAILVAEAVGIERCLGTMEAAGISLPAQSRRRSGLAAVVGASEVTLLDLTNAYATLGRGGERKDVKLFTDEAATAHPALSARTCAAIDEILGLHARDAEGGEAAWPERRSWFMWKTGTSAGRRDAWAVGHNRRVAAGVWVGRFSGGGSEAYVGAAAAQPLLESIFSLEAIRTDRPPTPPPPLRVDRPIPPPPEAAQGQGSIRILWPGNGAELASLSDTLTIEPRVTHREALTWFLNGRMVATGAMPGVRIGVGAGTHELRCVSSARQSTAVRFTVRQAPSITAVQR